MRLTTKGRFAVTAMLDLAMHGGKGPVTLAGISRRQSISLSYLEQLFGKLRRHTLVDSVRGPGGGYTLARDLQKVSIADIITAVDEPLDATQCGGKENCHDEQRCMTHDLWAKLNDKMYEYLDSVKLSDLVAQQATRKNAVNVLQDKRGKEAAVSARTGRARNEISDLPRLFRDHAGGPARGAENDSLPHRAVRQRGEPLARVRVGGGEGGGRGARGRGGAAERRPQGDHLDLGRHRRQQPRHQGRGEFLQGQGQAHRHDEDRAQGGARHGARARAPGLRGDLPRSAAERPARPGQIQGGAAPRYGPRVGDDGEQRDRRDPADRRDRRDLPVQGHYLSLRRGAGRRQDPDRPAEAEGGSADRDGAQGVRSEGHRRAVRAQETARSHRAADPRRRPRARLALGNAPDAPD